MFKSWFFNLVYFCLLTVFSPQLFYRCVKQGKYRRGLKQKFFGRIPKRNIVMDRCQTADSSEIKLLWFHAVSVGEVNLLRPVLKLIQETQPNWRCVISATSQTGRELADKLFGRDYIVFYCPLDFSWAAHKAIQRLRPDMLVLVEQELWSNLIDAAKKNGTKIAIINGRFSECGYKNYRWIRPLVAPMLQSIDAVAAQSEQYAGWFRQLGASSNNIHVIGSVKFDGANSDRNNSETMRLRKWATIADSDIVFLAGSTQAPEELYAVECYEHLKNEFPQLRLILVPRHPERFEEVAGMLDKKSVLWQRRTMLQETEKNVTHCEERAYAGDSTTKDVLPRIMLVDTVGELGAWWGTADIAFVGGSMGKRGGQNMIEPAAYGAAVCFGPNTKNFRDITDLMLRNGVAQVVNDQLELERFVRRCLEDPPFAATLGEKAQMLVKQQLGATHRTVEMLEHLL